MRQYALWVLGAIGWSVLLLAESLAAENLTSEVIVSEGNTQQVRATATFAGGCFWCVEAAFEKLPGVIEVISGYTGGDEPNPTYEQVSSGKTGHYEAIQVHYDPQQINYESLLQLLWRQIDPTDAGGQFVDRGHHYRAAIFYHDAQQRQAAEASLQALAASGRYQKPLAVALLALKQFYPAEAYHQNFYQQSPGRYNSYHANSGREPFLKKVWGADLAFKPVAPQCDFPPTAKRYQKPDPVTLRERLSDEQYEVTQQEATERPFANAYWDEKRDGIYVDIVSGEPLFSSLEKFDSGTGWPSFYRPLVADNLLEKQDNKLWMSRTEVRSRFAGSHLGHLFNDGPQPTGLRYCINSAALRFIPLEALAAEGYGEFLPLFQSR
ncbi:MAG: peptide-methionine (R)-S-oxide reductase MsrB [Gammaproteobacteria bacterium]|nr:peptide-methionine (R)-S-oxide reductase MsrB [Gammaproteobacteria bacterium]